MNPTPRRLQTTLGIIILLTATTASAQSLGNAQLIRAFADDPTPSPDGHELVYIATVSGKEQLWLMHADGSAAHALTTDSANHEDPAWSPDGRHIAYTSIQDSTETFVVIEMDGQNPRGVSPRSVRAIHPAWSRDGNAVLYCTDDDLRPPAKNDSQIYSVDVASGRVTQVLAGGVNTYPAISPDGKWLAFRRMLGEHNSEVFLADATGANAQNLTRNEAFDGWPDWSPDGRRIAFASNRGGNSYQVYVMNRDGSNVTLVANTTGRATAPRWSRDGEQIYFTNCYRAATGSRCDALRADAPR